MVWFKRLHWFMLKTFLPLFAMTFFIVLFIVLMQFLWRYINDLVGKGLGIGVIAELFFYAAVSMVPMALPLAILLASLMTFGNLGEKFELTAMKASGISLLRVMAPLIVTVGIIATGAFFFQNDVLPKAQVKMWTLLFSMRQKSPELEIPENVFYDKIPGFNLFVKDKNRDTGMLRGVTIYDVSKGGDNASVITADSAVLAFTPDMRYLYLHLYEGDQFENLRDQNNSRMNAVNTPFRRESFVDKQVLIPFDANFNRLDEGGMRSQYVGKNISELQHTIDSVSKRIDSIGRIEASQLKRDELRMVTANRSGRGSMSASRRAEEYYANAPGISSEAPKRQEYHVKVNTDGVPAITMSELLDLLSPIKHVEVINNAISISQHRQQMMQFRAQVMADEKKVLRRHDIELLKKFTLSVACIIFFFIGAPLGAIIRKGGLGTPLVISILLFVVYYIIDNTGYKMARDGKIEVWVGIWLSTFILGPLGVYVTWKAMNDAAVFDPDKVKGWMRKLIGARGSRSIASKEIIIEEVDTSAAIEMLEALIREATDTGNRYKKLIGYRRYWIEGINSADVQNLSATLEATVGYLANSRNPQVINALADFPVLRQVWVYHPVRKRWLAWVMMIAVPLSLPIYLAGLQAQKDLRADCTQIIERSRKIIDLLK